MCFFNSAEQAYLEQNVCFHTLKSLLGKWYSFEKQNQFSLGHKVLDAPTSILDGFLSRDSCVFQLR
jgi:hypothetical protein